MHQLADRFIQPSPERETSTTGNRYIKDPEMLGTRLETVTSYKNIQQKKKRLPPRYATMHAMTLLATKTRSTTMRRKR